MTQHSSYKNGFTLLEMLLVAAILGTILVVSINYFTAKSAELRRNRAALEFQQILGAATSYYINNQSWPTTSTTPVPLNSGTALMTDFYLTSPPLVPWGGGYFNQAINTTNNANAYVVSMTAPNATEANIVAGKLPTASVSGSIVSVQINAPVQSINAAPAAKQGNLYSSGGCVPEPVCPAGMTAQIFVAPAGVSGVYNDPTLGTPYSHAMSGFSAYAVGDPNSGNSATNQPADCSGTPTNAVCTASGANTITTGKFWRVCLSVNTEEGPVVPTSSAWGQEMGTILAITRCAMGNESTGSNLSVFVQ